MLIQILALVAGATKLMLASRYLIEHVGGTSRPEITRGFARVVEDVPVDAAGVGASKEVRVYIFQ